MLVDGKMEANKQLKQLQSELDEKERTIQMLLKDPAIKKLVRLFFQTYDLRSTELTVRGGKQTEVRTYAEEQLQGNEALARVIRNHSQPYLLKTVHGLRVRATILGNKIVPEGNYVRVNITDGQVEQDDGTPYGIGRITKVYA